MVTEFWRPILIVMLDKSHTTLITNNNEFWMKKIVNKIHFHPLTNHICIVVYD
jgi:hypothetical protein